MRKFLAIIILVSLVHVTFAWAEDNATRPSPQNAKTVADIIKAIEPNRGYGYLQSAQFNRWGREVLAVWYCPFSGRGDCFVQCYYFDREKGQWTRFVDKLVSATGDLSAEMPSGDTIQFRNPSSGKVALKESVARYPQRDCLQDEQPPPQAE